MVYERYDVLCLHTVASKHFNRLQHMRLPVNNVLMSGNVSGRRSLPNCGQKMGLCARNGVLCSEDQKIGHS
jgi:hypothetical protein